MTTNSLTKILEIGFKIRDFLNIGPAYLYYSVFWWCYPTITLREKVANCAYIDLRAHILRLSGIKIGKDTRIGYGTLIIGRGKNPPAVSFGERVAVAAYVTFVSSSYPDDSRLRHHPEIRSLIRKFAPIVVEDDCWIGTGATIFPGVTIGKMSIVGSGAIVLKDVPPYSIVAGSPAKCIRKIAEIKD